MVGLGIAMSRGVGWESTAGPALAAVGGVLISWTAGKAYSRDQARAEINAQLDALSRQLGTASGQISLAIDQAIALEIKPETCFALISQSTRTLYALLNEIQVMLGNAFDPADLLATVTAVDDLARKLNSRASASDADKAELSALQEQLASMKSVLARQAVPLGVEESVHCPKCAAVVRWRLGGQAGATSAARCSSCGTGFNVHRRSNGEVFTRPMVTAFQPRPRTPVTYFTVVCPNCGALDLPVRHRQGDLRSRSIVCPSCNGRLSVDVSLRMPTYVKELRVEDAIIVDADNSRPFVRCPKCQANIKAIMRRGPQYFGVCGTCDLLLRTDESSFDEWRSADASLATGEVRSQVSGNVEAPEDHFESRWGGS
jgi:transposase-like protein